MTGLEMYEELIKIWCKQNGIKIEFKKGKGAA